MRYNEIKEAPELGSGEKISIEDNYYRNKLAEILAGKHTKMATVSGVDLYKFVHHTPAPAHEIFIGVENKQIIYKVKILKAEEMPFDCYYQTELMSKKKGLASEVFFQVNLKVYRNMVTDATQSDGGKAHWYKLMEIAAKNNLEIRFMNLKDSQQDDLYDASSGPIKDWIDSKDAWKDMASYRVKRFVISN